MRLAIIATCNLLLLGANFCFAGRTPSTYVGYINKTGREISHLAISFDCVPAPSPGHLVKYGTATEGPLDRPVPKSATLKWLADGASHEASVPVASPTGARASTIYFVFSTNNSVLTQTLENTDLNGKSALWKDLRPAAEYKLCFINRTGADIGPVSLLTNGQPLAVVRSIPARVVKDYTDYLSCPVPSVAQLAWSQGETNYSAELDLQKIVPRGFAKGTVFLEIKSPENIKIHPIPWSDQAASIALFR